MRPPPEGNGDTDRARPVFPPLAHPDRLSPDDPHYEEVVAAHDEAVSAGRPGYTDPQTGLFVLTAAYLWARGTCCSQGCRHCPYVERPA